MAAPVLKEIDSAEIVVLADNYSDLFLTDTDQAKRMLAPPPLAPMSEPGLSILIKTTSGEASHTILLDTGVSGTCLLHNAKVLPNSLPALTGAVTARLEETESIVLSHGHFDHYGGLIPLLEQTQKSLPVYLHPDAFVPRRIAVTPEFAVPLPAMDEAATQQAGAEFIKSTGPVSIAADSILLSGEVRRQVDFEQGMPNTQAEINGEWGTDPFLDDQGLAIHIKGKGLVIIGGCSHSGIINTIKHFQEITGVTTIHAVMGGFHLAGENEKIIEPTISEMKTFNPDVIVPIHCTGWNAINRFSKKMPDQFILNSVGTTYLF